MLQYHGVLGPWTGDRLVAGGGQRLAALSVGLAALSVGEGAAVKLFGGEREAGYSRPPSANLLL